MFRIPKLSLGPLAGLVAVFLSGNALLGGGTLLPSRGSAAGRVSSGSAEPSSGNTLPRSDRGDRTPPEREGSGMLAPLPLAFVENRGQWEGPARFVARRGGMAALLAADALTFQLLLRAPDREGSPGSEVSSFDGELDGDADRVSGLNLRLVFEGARGDARLRGRDELPGRYNYFLGNDPAKWRTGVPGFGRVEYEGLYEGVNLVVREEGARFEYDLLLGPGANLADVVVRVEGASGPLRVSPEGALVFETALGKILQPRAKTWEERGRERIPVECAYGLLGKDRFGFEVPGWNGSAPLVIDPGLAFSTYLGGLTFDFADALAVDATGATTIAGYTTSNNFPATPGAFQAIFGGPATGGGDAFVAKISPLGDTLVYATFLGGTNDEFAGTVALDSAGGAVVGGRTFSPTFPVTNGTTINAGGGTGPSDGFIARLSPLGDALVFSTFVGSTGNESVLDLVLDATGAATMLGVTTSIGFPTTPGAFDSTYNGGDDAFVATLSPTGTGTLLGSTFVGGAGNEPVGTVLEEGIALDGTGAVTVTGRTTSVNFPATIGTYNAAGDGFVTRLSPTLSTLLWSIYLGGSGDDTPYDLAVDASGAATLVGVTASMNFPTTPGAFSTTFNGATSTDAFVTRVSPTGATLLWSTYLGGAGTDRAWAVAVDSTTAAIVAGETTSFGFPITTGSYAQTLTGAFDAFVTKLSPLGDTVDYSTFLGGAQADLAYAVVLDPMGVATVGGHSASFAFPTTMGAYDTTSNGGGDGFVARLDLLPTGAVPYGTPSPGCAGPPSIGVNSIPQIGNPSFAITCSNAPPSSLIGFLGFSAFPLVPPFSIFGINVWIDFGPAALGSFFLVPAVSNAFGASSVGFGMIPNDPVYVGGQIRMQFFWLGLSSPPPCPPLGISASNGLTITIQP